MRRFRLDGPLATCSHEAGAVVKAHPARQPDRAAVVRGNGVGRARRVGEDTSEAQRHADHHAIGRRPFRDQQHICRRIGSQPLGRHAPGGTGATMM